MPPVEAVLRFGTLPFITSGPRPSRGGLGELDSLSVELLCSENWEAEVDSEGYRHLRKISGYHSMWVQSHDPDPEASTTRVAIACVGLLKSGEKRKRIITAAGQQISVGPVEKTVLVWSDEEQGEDPETGDPVDRVKRRVPKLDEEGEPVYKTITTPSGNGERWDIRDAIVQVRDRYFTTTRPQTNVINTAVSPVNAPTPPPNPWVSYNEPMRFRHPNGWVLADRQIDELFWDGTQGLWAVDDLYEYFYPAVPD